MSDNAKTELAEKAPASEVRKVVNEFTRLTNLSADYSGNAGQYLRNQCERLGISAKTVRKLRSMERQDEGKRQSEIRETIYGWLAMGYFAQIDAFDDIRTLLSEALAATGGDGGQDSDDEVETAGKDSGSTEEGTRPSPRKRGAKKDATLDSLVH